MGKEKTGRKKINNLVELVGTLPKVALLGRPNVGKSTLFNRLIRSNRAITNDMPGVTRDRMEGLVRRKGERHFIIVDTGGINLDANASAMEGPAALRGFEEEILQQAKIAVTESDVLCLVVDAKDGLTPFDAHLADFLRRAGKPLLMVVNKVDGSEKAELLMAEFHALGLSLLPCSAEHGYNLTLLFDSLLELLPPDPESKTLAEAAVETDFSTETPPGAVQLSATLGKAEEDGMLRLAMLGRPNVGKSSLVNALAGNRRMIVSAIAGTTRDSVDVPAEISGLPTILVDSAGVRKRSKIIDSLERFSVNSALKTSTKAQVTLLVFDGQEGLTVQDKRLLELLEERNLPYIVLVNKADLIRPDKLAEVEKSYRRELVYYSHVPIIMVSAQNRRNLKKIMPLAREILKESQIRAGTGQLNRMLDALLQQRQPPLVNRKRVKIYYMTQAESSPPTFVFFVNDADRVPESYARYLERSLRKMLGIKHAPIRVHFRKAGK